MNKIVERLRYLERFARTTNGYGLHANEIDSIIDWSEKRQKSKINDASIMAQANRYYLDLCVIREQQEQAIPPFPEWGTEWKLGQF